jgi:hypothetical protein
MDFLATLMGFLATLMEVLAVMLDMLLGKKTHNRRIRH